MLQAMSTGHDGSLATVHANSAEDALMRLQTLGSMSEVLIPFEALKDQINSAVDVVVQLARHADGSRKVVEIALVVSHGREQFRVATVCRFVPQPLAADRIVRGRFEHLPLPRSVAEKLYAANEPLPPAFGVAEAIDALHTRQAIG
jgi:pilus assembly protein CpaF